MKTGFELILFSPEKYINNEIDTVVCLFNLGLKTFHLRKPVCGAEQTQRYLEAIPHEFHKRIVLHSHFQLSHKFQLKGIHLNEANKKLIQQFDNYKIISASFHSVKDIKENTFPYQYIFLSPVFDSISKPGYLSNFNLKDLKEEFNTTNSISNIIALGGITSENIMEIKQTSFSGAGLLGAVWQSENPVEAFLQIRLAIAD